MIILAAICAMVTIALMHLASQYLKAILGPEVKKQTISHIRLQHQIALEKKIALLESLKTEIDQVRDLYDSYLQTYKDLTFLQNIIEKETLPQLLSQQTRLQLFIDGNKRLEDGSKRANAEVIQLQEEVDNHISTLDLVLQDGDFRDEQVRIQLMRILMYRYQKIFSE